MPSAGGAPVEVSLFGDLLSPAAPVARDYPFVNTTATVDDVAEREPQEDTAADNDAARLEKDEAAAALIGTWGRWVCGRVKHEVAAIGRGPTILLNGLTINLNRRIVITTCGEEYKLSLWTRKEKPGLGSCGACGS